MGMGCCCGGCDVEYSGFTSVLGTWSNLGTQVPSNTGITEGFATANYTFDSPSMRVIFNTYWDFQTSPLFIDDRWIGAVLAYDSSDGSYLLARIHGWADPEAQLCKYDGSSLTVLESATLTTPYSGILGAPSTLGDVTACFDSVSGEFMMVIPPAVMIKPDVDDGTGLPTHEPYIVRATGVTATGTKAGVYINDAQRSSSNGTIYLSKSPSRCPWCGCDACGRGGAPLSHTVEISSLADDGGWFEDGGGTPQCTTDCSDLNGVAFVIDHEGFNWPCEYVYYSNASITCAYIIRVRYDVTEGQLYRLVEVLLPDFESAAVCDMTTSDGGAIADNIVYGGRCFYIHAVASDSIDSCGDATTDAVFALAAGVGDPPSLTSKCDWSGATVSVAVTMP